MAEVTQSAAKKARKDTVKFTNKRKDPAALAKLEEGDVAFKAENWALAKACFEEATQLAKSSSVEKVKKEKAPKPPKAAPDPKNTTAVEEEAPATCVLRDPKENLEAKPKSKGIEKTFALNTPEQLATHLKATSGAIRTRFPPEPNGYLHIGHAKAMNFNFGQAKLSSGGCILRFDDTNPTAEKQEYIDSILDSVAWLGHEPMQITYSSDYFEELYALAIKLIERGEAYVCHQTAADIAASRALCKKAQELRKKDPNAGLPEGAESPWRNRSVEDNLQLFEEMRMGLWDEGSAFLRFKGNLESDNPNMWDLAAYRIMFSEHPHSKDKWCVYPTYDYTHCIVDSLENITHSLCTLEFELRQAAYGSYYWLLDKLDMYKPVTWEYSRCNIEYNVLSKRKLNQLVTHGHVNGWDDPRLLTIFGMKRRGYSANAINKFCTKIGVTRAENLTKMEVLEGVVRSELDEAAPRAFAILDPLVVRISNHPGGAEWFELSVHPKKDMGKRRVPFSGSVVIDRSDFREEDAAGYYGLAPGKEVKLLGAYNITCTEVKYGSDGTVSELIATYDKENSNKPKGNLSWLSLDHAVPAEVRLYNKLFSFPIPGKRGTDDTIPDQDEEEEAEVADAAGTPQWLKDLNPDSMVIINNALVEASVAEKRAAPGSSFQFMRVGYFTVDLDSSASNLVLNRVVSLKESADAKALR